jgi:L-threonylcarbamoyladenylate synthase
VESTIVKIDGEDALTLLRPGAITVEMLLQVAGTVKVADAVLDRLAEGETILSPGMKYRHYAPRAPLSLLDGGHEAATHYLLSQNGRIAVLCYTEELAAYRAALPNAACYALGRADHPEEQAQRLFALLRDIDRENYDAIYAPLPKAKGMGMALYNRMIRAAAHHIVHLLEKEQS